jgi:hypothetical protein
MSKNIALMSGLVFLLLSAIGFAEMGMMKEKGMMGMMNMSMVRHHYVMRNGIGSEYSSKENSLVVNKDNLHAGKMLYDKNCSSCHGSSGYGDGPAGKNLNPRPANIVYFSKMPMATDGYLFWTISEGGIPIQTAMPAFKSSLKEEEIWKIIIYLRDM